jgi:3-isopropylmalate dehydratase small subunit
MKYEDLRADEDSLLAMNGRAWRCEDAVSSAVILQPSFAASLAIGDFIVAGLDFAADTDAEQRRVVAALKTRNLAAVIARSFGAVFLRQALQLGLPALVIEETGAIKHGDRLRVDIEAHVIANLSSGDRYVVRNINDAELHSLRVEAWRRLR